MDNKLVTILTIILLIVIVVMLFIFGNINQESDDAVAQNNISIYTQNENTDNNFTSKEVNTNVIPNTTIQGIVELKKDDIAYIFGGEHFGEYGYEMEEYTTAYIQLKDKICIDYISSKEYSTDYIEVGDILICTGDLTQGEYNYNNMGMKENNILVLKEKDYRQMQEEVLNDDNAIITIGDMYLLKNDDNTNLEGSHMYIKYQLESKRNSEEKYSFPFSKKVYITDKTEVIGDLREGAKIKIQYDFNKTYTSGDAYSGFELESIEVVE